MPARASHVLVALAAAVLPALLAPTAFAQGSASFAQLAGQRGCLQPADTDEGDVDVDETCGFARALMGPTGVAVSPDQEHVYVATGQFDGSDAITTFARDPQTGALDFGSCISDSGGDGRVGTDGFCSDGDALLGATDIAFSPDGRFVYVASSASNGLAWFERDATTGALTQRGCLKAFPRQDRCAEAAGLGGANGVALSPGGEHVYVTAGGSDAVNVFSRDAQTGAVTEVMCVSDSGSDGRCVNGTGLEGASSVVAASDGRNVYVTAADVGAVTAYARDATTGRLLQNGCLLDDAPSGGPCRSAPALAGAADATLTPDGRQLLVASQTDSALAVFGRDGSTGALEPSTCFVHQEPQGDDDLTEEEDFGDEEAGAAAADGCRPARALGGVAHVVVSPDGRGVFTANGGDYLSAFQRDPASGRLEQFGCAEEERTYRACSPSRNLFSMEALAVSADARNLYVASSAGVSVFAASVAIASRSARVSRRGAVHVRLVCPAGRRAACRGRLSARKGGAQRYRIAAGRTATLRLRLPAAVRRTAVRRGRAHVTLVASDARRLTSPSVRRLLVRRPAAAAGATASALAIAFRTVERSSGTGSRLSEQRTIVVRSLRKYKQVWRQLHPTPKKRPKVDFSKHMLILATQGQKPSSGYAIKIESITAEDGEIILHVAESEPDPAAIQCSYLQVITRPYHLVRVRKSARPVGPVQRRTDLVTC